jgi:uncharacterized protein (TIGR02231 family)
VTFAGLPMALDERTLRADGTGGATAIGVTSRVEVLEQDRDARVAELRAALHKVEDEIAGVRAVMQTEESRGGVVVAYENYVSTVGSEELRNARPDTRAIEAALDLFEQERVAQSRRAVEQGRELRRLERERERLQARLERYQPETGAEARVVEVAVECGAGVREPGVRLSYVVPGATWHPEYDLRFAPDGAARVGPGRAELTVGAVVQQATGEDWTDARLVLSTAQPRLGSDAPVPAPLYVRGHEAGKEKVLVEATERRDKLAAGEAPDDAAPESAVLEDRGQSFTLTLPRRVDVHTDGRPYWMPVDVTEARATSKLVAVPKLRPHVFQVVALANPAAYPLLAGRVHVYRGGTWVGDVRTEYRAPGEPMEVSLGIDEEVKVERTALHRRERGAGLLSDTKHIDHAWRIGLENRTKGRVTVEVREHVPVSKVEDVRVDVVKEKTTKGYAHDAHRGFLTWEVALASGEKKAVDLAFGIHLPENWQVRMR